MFTLRIFQALPRFTRWSGARPHPAYPAAPLREFPSLQKPRAFQSVSERFMSFLKWGNRAKNLHVSMCLSACIFFPIRLIRFRAFQSVSHHFIDHGDQNWEAINMLLLREEGRE
jgi:hypothetical protein